MTAILGISAFYHDSAAALVIDGRVVAAAQEERFTRKKHDHEFPVKAIEFCLAEAGLEPSQLDFVGFYDKPLLKFDRLLETYLAYAPAGFGSFLTAIPKWLKQKLHLPREMRNALGGAYTKPFVFAEHHESHAASAFFPSPFDEAAILTLDGVGEWATASVGVGRGNRVEILREQHFPHSIGLLYSAFTYYCGFTVNSGEYKLMGLAPYGEPRYVDRILDKLIDLKEDGSLRMDMSYFNYCAGLTMTSKKFDKLFEGPPRKPDSLLTQRDMDIAASIQKVTEEVMLRSARYAHELTGMKKLCLAGGVALNCVGNGRILREGPFDEIWIQPAAGDSGGALGVAQLIWYQLLDNPREPKGGDLQRGSLLGPSFSDDAIRSVLEASNTPYEYLPNDHALCDRIAAELDAGKVIGWFQGPMEFGPRALGSRSILGDPRRPDMQATINLKVKFREGFRPFAPAVLEEHAGEYFEAMAGRESPYMLLVTPVRDEKRRPLTEEEARARGIERLKQHRSEIPAVTHVDYSARVQTVDRERHGIFRTLLESFYRRTGCPVVINTSFNLGWDPIVCTPQEALETFMDCDIDVLCMGHFVVSKARQPAYVTQVAPNEPDPILAGVIASPITGGELIFDGDRATCKDTGHVFEREDGIWKLFWPHEKFDDPSDVTRMVKEFYEETPFPNYDDFDSVRSLIEKSRQGLYTRALTRAIPANSKVLEVGCGTGQLTNFLGISCRQVIGSDLCLNSLRLGEQFRRSQGLERVRFVQMNLFRPAFRREQFDVILCNGVLHHTADPYGGYRGLVPLLKPGGYIVIGLYNTYGRLMTDFRRLVFRMTGGRAKWIDPMLRRVMRAEGKRKAWFADQYQHPHESKHTIDETLRWFDETGIEFVRGVPSVTPEFDPIDKVNLFEPRRRGTRIEHTVVQLEQIFAAGQKEGGFFVMIGRKPDRPEAEREVEPLRSAAVG